MYFLEQKFLNLKLFTERKKIKNMASRLKKISIRQSQSITKKNMAFMSLLQNDEDNMQIRRETAVHIYFVTIIK